MSAELKEFVDFFGLSFTIDARTIALLAGGAALIWMIVKNGKRADSANIDGSGGSDGDFFDSSDGGDSGGDGGGE